MMFTVRWIFVWGVILMVLGGYGIVDQIFDDFSSPVNIGNTVNALVRIIIGSVFVATASGLAKLDDVWVFRPPHHGRHERDGS